MGKLLNNFTKFIKKNKNIITSCIVIIALLAAIYFYANYFDILKDPVKIKNAIKSYGSYSTLVFIGLQILQVVVFFIPGEFIQIASGFIYGTFLGGIISLAGITIGSFLCFSIANKFGKPFVEKIISEKQFKFYHKTLKSKNLNNIVLLFFLIPGIPKDALSYICGVSKINLREFMIYSTIGRIPGIFVSSYFGYEIINGNIIKLSIIAIVMSLLFFIGVINVEKIISTINKKFKK